MKNNIKNTCLLLIILSFTLLLGCSLTNNIDKNRNSEQLSTTTCSETTEINNDISPSIPEYNGYDFIELNNNIPEFTTEEKSCTEAFEIYSNLDSLGRCGAAFANVCKELMPTEERGDIGDVKPSGWHTIQYPEVIEDLYLYNRCHLIAFSLCGENSNVYNLITGTGYMNQEIMPIFELKVLDYVSSTDNHVLYRVTPIFEGDNLVATGVKMEAWSVEDNGKTICFNVFCYNIQPGINIDYSTGNSYLLEEVTNESANSEEEQEENYVLNTNTKKIHLPSCKSIDDMAEHNKQSVISSIGALQEQGYQPCKRCLGDK
ncbi:MAG: DNA/RNA non-specific endonuclease [Lachnospiraceae bacterium]|nr:DNA/RNA non-specific endonuclease [Lachnospiraceae bacterium]